MLGLSLAETAIILLVVLLVVGPKELPAVARGVMRLVRQMRGMAAEFRSGFDELMHEAKIDEIREDLTPPPTIIDLEGKPQRTYDISDELAEYDSRRKPKDDAEDKDG